MSLLHFLYIGEVMDIPGAQHKVSAALQRQLSLCYYKRIIKLRTFYIITVGKKHKH